MKTILIIGAIVVVGAVGFLTLNKKSAQETPQDSKVLQSVTSASSSATITTLARAVFLKQPTATEKQEVVATSSAVLGSTVATGEVGRALIEESSKKMVLDFNTEIILAVSNAGGESHKLSAGSMWSRVEKIFEKGEFYEVQTKNAVAAVRGTSFNVSYEGNITSLLVDEGTVWFAPVDELTGKVDETKALLVGAGKKASRSGNGNIMVSDISTTDKADKWYIFNHGEIKKTPASSAASTSATAIVTKTSSSTKTTQPATTKSTVSPSTTGSTPTAGGGSRPSVTGGGSTDGANTVSSQQGAGDIFIKSISPARIAAGSTEEPITLSGSGFNNAKTLFVGKTIIADFVIDGDNQIVFGLTESIGPGTYDVSLVTSSNSKATLRSGLTVYSTANTFNQYQAQ